VAGCCESGAAALRLSRRILWAVLAINAAMFVIEAAAGWRAASLSLQADALDFLGDSANYAIALFVLARSVAWRAGSALAKGLVMVGFGVFLLGASVYHVAVGSAPEAPVMGVVGVLALAANLGSVLLLLRYKDGDANVRSVWLCSRNDAIGNIAVLLAALGVWLSGTAWPDLIVAAVMATIFLWSALLIVRQALGEIRYAKRTAVAE